MENKLNSMYQIIQSYNNYDENLIINNYDKHDDRIDLIGKNDERESESEMKVKAMTNMIRMKKIQKKS